MTEQYRHSYERPLDEITFRRVKKYIEGIRGTNQFGEEGVTSYSVGINGTAGRVILIDKADKGVITRKVITSNIIHAFHMGLVKILNPPSI
jgi:hypothetical protein